MIPTEEELFLLRSWLLLFCSIFLNGALVLPQPQVAAQCWRRLKRLRSPPRCGKYIQDYSGNTSNSYNTTGPNTYEAASQYIEDQFLAQNEI